MHIKKIVYISVGCLSVALGAAGTAIPLLPSFPFLLLAAFCFARSSERLHNWFVHTHLYKKNLESWAQGRGMACAVKVKIITAVTVLMGIGFIMMKDVPVARIVLSIVWILHILYFLFAIKTLPKAA